MILMIEASPPFRYLPKFEHRPECIRLVWLYFAISVWRGSLAECFISMIDRAEQKDA